MILKDSVHRLVVLVYNFEHLIKAVDCGFHVLPVPLFGYDDCVQSELTNTAYIFQVTVASP
jgi:hypothetical protein